MSCGGAGATSRRPGEGTFLRPLVFLGPSLPVEKARHLCDAEYRPPIRRGDLGRCSGPAPRVIGIIDGAFHQSLTVSPGEILAALQAGHHVCGAGSVGALRAVELAKAGMVGLGRVYEAFAAGRTEREDEVAVVFDPDSGRALSDPLIGMRVALTEARDAGLLDDAEWRLALAIAEATFYPSRRYEAIVAALGIAAARRGPLLRFLRELATDFKAEDAKTLLRYIAGQTRPGRTALPAALEARPSLFATLRSRQPMAAERPSLSRLPPAPKVAGWTSVRTRTAEATNAMLADLHPRFGVTRIAEITHLDVLGVPCYSAIRPGCGVSAYSGKALTPLEARVGAQMEALEATLAYETRVPTRRATYDTLAAASPALDPGRLPVVGSERRNLRAVELNWISGWNLRTGDAIWLPVDAVFLRPGSRPPWSRSSNGLAAGNCLTEALAHAVAEIIERDALTIQALTTELGHLSGLLRALARPAGAPPSQVGRGYGAEVPYPFVNLASLPAPLLAVVEAVERAGAVIDLRWVASDVPVPVFLCMIHEASAGGSLTHAGSGAHPNAAVAARRAITEAAQSRLTYIHGVREDLMQPAVTPAGRPTDGWFDRHAPRVDFSTFGTHVFPDVTDDLRDMVEALGAVGLDEIYVADLSHQDIPFAVARVIVPGAEPPLEFEDPNRVALGWRGRSVLLSQSS